MSVVVCGKCGTFLAANARFCTKCGDTQKTVPERLQDSLGPDYEVIGELGRGGAAVVYSVRDRQRRRYLAVKVMHPALTASQEVVERFRREVQFASDLDHPNILSVTFSSEEPALVYYAMPRVRGKPLSKRVDAGRPMPLDESLQILKQVASGLDHAHEHGVIHRDIKPSNIMVDDRGHVLILDFGVAKALSWNGKHISASGEVLGSPHYMSPEQATGSSDIDHRTDIYSWGIVAFHMLAGRVPFDDTNVHALLKMQINADPPDLRTFRPDAPKGLAESLGSCMAKNPTERWSTVREAAAAAGCELS